MTYLLFDGVDSISKLQTFMGSNSKLRVFTDSDYCIYEVLRQSCGDVLHMGYDSQRLGKLINDFGNDKQKKMFADLYLLLTGLEYIETQVRNVLVDDLARRYDDVLDEIHEEMYGLAYASLENAVQMSIGEIIPIDKDNGMYLYIED